MVRVHSTVILQGGLAMTSSRIKNVGLIALTVLMLLSFGCKKKVAAAPTPPPPLPPTAPPPPPAPAITLRAAPTTINRGQNTTLTWEARNATTVRIEPGLGDVGATGNRSVNPASSVTYQATATGRSEERRVGTGCSARGS